MENFLAGNYLPASPTSVTDNQEILDDIGARMHGPMNKRVYQYAHQDTLLEVRAAGGGSSCCCLLSATPLPDDFLEWVSNYTSWGLDGSRGSWHMSSRNVAPKYDSANDGARLLLTIPASPGSSAQTR